MGKVKITDEMKKEAREMSDECLSNLKSTSNYADLYMKDRFYNGFLGEIVFREYLDNNSVEYEHIVELDGKSHGVDFVCYFPGEKTVDVKTATKSYYKYMMMPSSQYDKSDCDLYVGVKISDDTGYVLGYSEKKDFKKLDMPSLKIETMGIMFDDLKEII